MSSEFSLLRSSYQCFAVYWRRPHHAYLETGIAKGKLGGQAIQIIRIVDSVLISGGVYRQANADDLVKRVGSCIVDLLRRSTLEAKHLRCNLRGLCWGARVKKVFSLCM